MKDHIHTIPVLDALREPGRCPFCEMYRSLDEKAVDFIMGPAYMDEDIRNETNEAGFCANHLRRLYAVQNRLGAALLLHTHFKQALKSLRVKDDAYEVSGGLFKKSESVGGKIAGRVDALQKRCYLCERIQGTFEQYVDTFFYMWIHERELIPLIENLPGFCIPHYGMLLGAAEKKLNKKNLENFLSVIIPLQQRAMEALENDIDWFVQKFDYRNTGAPWKNSKDAINRCMAMLKGVVE